jgi:sulfur relay (sulfurtransferase) DsrC/TusE family protein
MAGLDKEVVINCIKIYHKKYNRTPSTNQLLSEFPTVRNLKNSILKYGGIVQLRSICGLNEIKTDGLDKEVVINCIKMYHQKYNRTPSENQLVSEFPTVRGLKNSIGRYGGIVQLRSICGFDEIKQIVVRE